MSDYLIVWLLCCRTIGLSDYWVVRLLCCRTIGLSIIVVGMGRKNLREIPIKSGGAKFLKGVTTPLNTICRTNGFSDYRVFGPLGPQ